MHTGILGGAFDPIHIGHIDLAMAARQALALDRVLLLPTGASPSKRLHAHGEDRLKMVEIAIEDHAGLFACDVELNTEGKSYTADTLRALKAIYPDDDFTFILGADALERLPGWRDVDDVVGMCRFAVATRGDDRVAKRAAEIAGRLNADISVLDFQPEAVSSGIVRARVAKCEPIDGLVPRGVAGYIRENGLYLCGMTEDELINKLRGSITMHRFYHTMGVAATAQRLASRFGVDPMRARLAALLHDCAKSMPYGEMRSIVERFVPDTDEQELDAEPVLHAPAGAVVARRDYGVTDEAVLQAIRRHTLGDADMTALDALIYVADFIEPGRRSFDGLETARSAAEEDIFEAMRICATLTTRYVESRGQASHPKTLELLKTK